METYLGLYFKVFPKEPWTEILLAQLQNLPFETFEITKKELMHTLKSWNSKNPF